MTKLVVFVSLFYAGTWHDPIPVYDKLHPSQDQCILAATERVNHLNDIHGDDVTYFHFNCYPYARDM